MLLEGQNLQPSFYAMLYNLIPDDHILKRINQAVDFSFINPQLESSYSKYYGRPAKEPEMMVKLLILQYLYSLSDERIIEEASLNLAYKWFLGLNPEDKLPDPSLLAKFRVHRLKDNSLDEIITIIVKQCVEKGIIKSTSLSIDATHTAANTGKLIPERIMKRLAQKILKKLAKEKGEIPEHINQEIPDYKAIESPQEAKQTMKQYLEGLIEQVGSMSNIPETAQIIEKAKQIITEEKFIMQKGQRSLVDEDARVGHKSKNDNFFGFKTEFVMTTEERIITAVTVESGEYTDGKRFDQLLEQTQKSGIIATEMYADKAYFRHNIVKRLKNENIEAYIPVSGSAYRIDEELFRYNKDSDEWFCLMGNKTVSKRQNKFQREGKEVPYLEFVFDKAQCKACSNRERCMGKSKANARKLRVSINTSELYEISQKQKTEEFREKYKKRAAHEWKNGEMKRFHGLCRARGYGLKSMTVQAKLTALAVNLKRIAALAAAILYDFCFFRLRLSVFC